MTKRWVWWIRNSKGANQKAARTVLSLILGGSALALVASVIVVPFVAQGGWYYSMLMVGIPGIVGLICWIADSA